MSTASPTPAPIPALAPVESPDEGELIAFASVEDGGVAVADEVAELEIVVAVAIVAPTNCSVSDCVLLRIGYSITLYLRLRLSNLCRLLP